MSEGILNQVNKLLIYLNYLLETKNKVKKQSNRFDQSELQYLFVV